MKRATNIIVLCGTDTGVGKTIVTGLLCRELAKQKLDFTVFKPFESGAVKRKGGNLLRPDTDFLCKMSQGRATPDQANLYAFREALAPAIAARRSGIRVDWGLVLRTIHAAARKHKLVLVEGAGGLLAPLCGQKTNLDLMRDLKAHALIVGRLGLGTINHTRLTYDRLRLEKIPVLGIILSQTTSTKTLADKTNVAELGKMGLPLIGVLPFFLARSGTRA